MNSLVFFLLLLIVIDIIMCLFQLPALQEQAQKKKCTILKELVSLDTPGKSTVEVVILADPVSCCTQ